MNIIGFQKKITEIWGDMGNAVLNKSPEITSMVKKLTTIDLTVRKMATTHMGLLISTAVSFLEDECYVNIGTWNGYSFFAGFILNTDKVCIGNDNFSLFNKEYSTKTFEKDKANRDFGDIPSFFYKEFNRLKNENVIFVEKDWRDFLNGLSSITDKKVGFYFYDGDHSFDAQYDALVKIIPYLSDNAVILVDDTNLEDVRGANEKFLKNYSEFKLLYDISTPCNRYPTWWNGIQVIGREKS